MGRTFFETIKFKNIFDFTQTFKIEKSWNIFRLFHSCYSLPFSISQFPKFYRHTSSNGWLTPNSSWPPLAWSTFFTFSLVTYFPKTFFCFQISKRFYRMWSFFFRICIVSSFVTNNPDFRKDLEPTPCRTTVPPPGSELETTGPSSAFDTKSILEIIFYDLKIIEKFVFKSINNWISLILVLMCILNSAKFIGGWFVGSRDEGRGWRRLFRHIRLPRTFSNSCFDYYFSDFKAQFHFLHVNFHVLEE